MARPRDLFGVGVRLIGIWLLYQALYWGFFAFWKNAGGPGNPNVSIGEDVAVFLLNLIGGTALLLLADSIVRIVYGPQIRAVLTDDANIPSTGGPSDNESPP